MAFTEVDSTYEDRHILFGADAPDNVRESLAYLLPLPEHGLGVIVYTWVHAAGADGKGRAGAMAVVYGPGVPTTVTEAADGIGVPDELGFDNWEVGPIHLRMQGTTASQVTFAGERIAIDYRFEGINPSFAFLPHPGGCPSWLADDRTEQGGRVVGTLTVDGREYSYDTFGHRDHSWGVRDWGGPTHWKWWNVMAPGTSIHFMELQAFGRTSVHGYVHRDGVTALITGHDADYDFDESMMHTDVRVTFTDDAGRSTAVRTWHGADLHWPVSPFLTLHEASMHAEVDGTPAVAYIEMAWPPAYLDHHSTAPTELDAGDLVVDRNVTVGST